MAITPEVLLVNKEYIVKYTNMNASVDAELVDTCVILAQDTRVETAIGSQLMRAIKDGDYTALLDDYVRRAVAWWAFSELLPHLYVKIEAGGLFMRTADNGEQVTPEEFRMTRNEAESKARVYTKKLVDYIVANTSSFPEYSTNQFPDRHPQGDGYDRMRFRISNGNRSTSNRGRDQYL
jgi:hypothetical protein